MLETSHVWGLSPAPFLAVAAVLALTACALQEPQPPEAPKAAAAAPAPKPDPGAAMQEARALLAQAETDVQRARAKRALWLKAWESLVLARQAAAAEDNAGTARHSRKASEFAQLGLEQLAYPAVQ